MENYYSFISGPFSSLPYLLLRSEGIIIFLHWTVLLYRHAGNEPFTSGNREKF
jgi:hypothetical protein